MDFNDLVSLDFERSNAMQTFWGLYITITLGLLAVFASLKYSSRKIILAFVASVGFIGFAIVNGDALYDVTQVRNATQSLIAGFHDKNPQNQPTIDRLQRRNSVPNKFSGNDISHCGRSDCSQFDLGAHLAA